MEYLVSTTLPEVSKNPIPHLLKSPHPLERCHIALNTRFQTGLWSHLGDEKNSPRRPHTLLCESICCYYAGLRMQFHQPFAYIEVERLKPYRVSRHDHIFGQNEYWPPQILCQSVEMLTNSEMRLIYKLPEKLKTHI